MTETNRPPHQSPHPASSRRRLWLMAAGAICLASLAAWGLLPRAAAQGQARPPADPGAGGAADAGPMLGQGVPTVYELFMTSPYINGALLALSVLAVLMFLYLLLVMTGRSLVPPRFIDNATKLIINRQFDQAINLCQNHGRVFSASIIQRLVESRDKGPAVLMGVLAAEGRRRGEIVWNRIGYLAEIANIAPMIGLLGTVIGMIKVFFTLTTRTVGEKAAQLSGGIAEAMGTTMFGLIVAIMAGVFYTIVKGRATAALTEAEHVCHTIADHTHRAAEPDSPPGRPRRPKRRGRGRPRQPEPQPTEQPG